MNRSIGNSESTGATSPKSDLKGAPKRRRAVGWASSAISRRIWVLSNSRLRSADISIVIILIMSKTSYSVLVCRSEYSILE